MFICFDCVVCMPGAFVEVRGQPHGAGLLLPPPQGSQGSQGWNSGGQICLARASLTEAPKGPNSPVYSNVYIFETGSCYVVQASFELTVDTSWPGGLSEPPVSTQVLGQQTATIKAK